DDQRAAPGVKVASMHCPSCSFDNPEGLKFCGACAAPLKSRCPQCGFENPPGFKFCGACATALTVEVQSPKSQVQGGQEFRAQSSESGVQKGLEARVRSLNGTTLKGKGLRCRSPPKSVELTTPALSVQCGFILFGGKGTKYWCNIS